MSAPVAAPGKGHNVTIENDVESHLHPTPSWEIADHPIPTGREEIWRFTPIKTFIPVLSEVALEPRQEAGIIDVDVKRADGITVTDLATSELKKLAETPQDRLSALAAADPHAVNRRVVIPAETSLKAPVEVTVAGHNDEIACHHNVVVEIGNHAEVTVIVRHRGVAHLGENWTFRIGDGAQATVLFVQEWDDAAIHGAQVSFEIGRDATVRTAQASFGGKAVRICQTASYNGPGGNLTQLGAYFAGAGQHIEHRLFVDHNAPSTESHVDFRGCLQGKDAHSVWIGDVLIRPVAEDIDTYESNKNLVLTEGCRADAVPNLEIQTGNIRGAGHSASTGRFDAEQLFYLQSRGVEEAEARRLVVHGFFTDIVRKIGVPEISEELVARIEAELVESLGSSPSVEEG